MSEEAAASYFKIEICILLFKLGKFANVFILFKLLYRFFCYGALIFLNNFEMPFCVSSQSRTRYFSNSFSKTYFVFKDILFSRKIAIKQSHPHTCNTVGESKKLQETPLSSYYYIFPFPESPLASLLFLPSSFFHTSAYLCSAFPTSFPMASFPQKKSGQVACC